MGFYSNVGLSGYFSTPEEEYAAGFVLNKLYTLKYFGRAGNISHNGHTQLTNMMKSFPKDRRGTILKVCDRMKNRLVLIFKSDGEDHICALHETESMRVGLIIANNFRKQVGLPPLDKFLKEADETLPVQPTSIVYVPLTDKERRSKVYYEKNIKKWVDHEGLT